MWDSTEICSVLDRNNICPFLERPVTQGVDCLRAVPVKDPESTFPPQAAFPPQGLNCSKRDTTIFAHLQHPKDVQSTCTNCTPISYSISRDGFSRVRELSTALHSASPPPSAALQGIGGAAISLQVALSQHCSPEAPACRGMAPMTHEIEVLTP